VLLETECVLQVLKVARTKDKRAAVLLETNVCWNRANHVESLVSDCLGKGFLVKPWWLGSFMGV